MKGKGTPSIGSDRSAKSDRLDQPRYEILPAGLAERLQHIEIDLFKTMPGVDQVKTIAPVPGAEERVSGANSNDPPLLTPPKPLLQRITPI